MGSGGNELIRCSVGDTLLYTHAYPLKVTYTGQNKTKSDMYYIKRLQGSRTLMPFVVPKPYHVDYVKLEQQTSCRTKLS